MDLKFSLKVLFTLTITVGVLAAQAVSSWVYPGPDKKLHYRTDERGNRIMDFSHAGYGGGGVRLPFVALAKTLGPESGDNTSRIQAAIDAVAKLPLDSRGFRGAVVLKPGVYDVAGTISITASGVVLRGSGSGDGGTTIRLTSSAHRFLELRGAGSWEPVGEPVAITDAYVPSGADSFHVARASGFRVGDTVLIQRPVTKEWVHFMGMDTLVRDGKPQTWLAVGAKIRTDRVIRSINGNRITLDVPLSDSLDAGASLVKYAFPGRISQVGVENMRITAPGPDVPRPYMALRMDAVLDGWVRDLDIRETQNTFMIGSATKRITLERVRTTHTVPHTGGAPPADFAMNGTQILVDRCSANGTGSWPLVTQAAGTGPMVVLNFTSDFTYGIAPHQRWSTGLLVDNCRLPNVPPKNPGIAFSNRKWYGSGHGWTMGWAVAWNVTSPYLLVQQPPGAINWCIGCVGEEVTMPGIPSGVFDSRGVPVTPASLYLAQLRDRLGLGALENIGYSDAN